MTADIGAYLQLVSPVVHRQSVDRPNISYAMYQVDGESSKTEWIKERVRTTTGPGIIYVSSRKRADELAFLLQEGSIATASYHAERGRKTAHLSRNNSSLGNLIGFVRQMRSEWVYIRMTSVK